MQINVWEFDTHSEIIPSYLLEVTHFNKKGLLDGRYKNKQFKKWLEVAGQIDLDQIGPSC